MYHPFWQFYKQVVLRFSEHGDVIETQTIKVCPPKVFQQTRSLVGIIISQQHGLVCISGGDLPAFAIIKSSFLVYLCS